MDSLREEKVLDIHHYNDSGLECFIMMPSNRKFDDIYNIYRDTCKELGVKARSVRVKGSVDIIRNTLESILRSDFAIIDITGRNPNVMYELGYLMGRRNEAERMILLSQSKSSPFDIRHLHTIRYSPSIEGIKEMKEELKDKINGIINFNYTAHNCVYFFYKYLSLKPSMLNISWGLLSEEFRNRCYNNDFTLFESGYKSHTIRSLNIEKISSTDGRNCHFYVSYIASCEVPEIKDYPIPYNCTLGDIAKIKLNIAAIKKSLVQKGLNVDSLDQIPLRFAVAKNHEDIFLFYLRKGQTSNKHINIYPNTQQVEVANFYDVTVNRAADTKWYITKIISLY